MNGDGGLYLSYHNNDMDCAFGLSLLLLRCYRQVWLDRLEIAPSEDWTAGILQARVNCSSALVLVSNHYLKSPQCRAEYELLSQRDLPLTAVIASDVATDQFAEFNFSDWIDFRRWFEDPSDQSAESLLSRIPQAESAPQPGERLEYLRGFIHEMELGLAKMPTAWAALRNADASGGGDIRPRTGHFDLLGDWDFTGRRPGAALPIDDLRAWARTEPQFIIYGGPGSGKTTFAQLLALEQAHAALRDEAEALPIWLDLALWDDQLGSLDAFLESQWQLLTYWQRWLEQQTSLIVLDNLSHLQSRQAQHADAIWEWIEASPRQRFILLSRGVSDAEPHLPSVEIGTVTMARAQRFASHHLTLRQQNDFRQLLRARSDDIAEQPLAHLALGTELLAADRALAHSQWTKDPLPALIALRMQQLPGAAGGLSALQLLRALQELAWEMMLVDQHRFIRRDVAEGKAQDERVIPAALALGLLQERGGWLHFQPEMLQWYLATEPLKRDGLIKFIAKPEFSGTGERLPRKWDALALLIVSGLAEDSRARALERIAEIDPFLATMDLRSGAPPSQSLQETLVDRLLKICAGNSLARPALREALASIPNADATAETLIARLGQYNSETQLWLWQEVRALPLDLPLDFIALIAGIDRETISAVPQQLAVYPLALAVAWLVKLSAHQDATLRRKALWTLGELKYLPTAILLLDDLQNGDDIDQDEVLAALMKFAYSEILARVLRWSQAQPSHRRAVVKALAERKRLVTSRLLDLADARQLTLNDEFFDLAVASNEADIAIGLAQIAAEAAPLPEEVETTVLTHQRADELREEMASVIKYLPNRDQFAQLVDDIAAVLQDPPDATVQAGSKLEALVYGQSPFVDEEAQASVAPALPFALRQQLKHDDWQQRHRAINSLADYPVRQSLPHLLQACDDGDSRVRLAAYDMLSRFEGENSAQAAVLAGLADPETEVARAVTEMLKTLPALDYDAVLDLLDSDIAAVSAAAIDILGEARYQPAVRDLTRLLNSPRSLDDGGSISQLARVALEKIGEAESPPVQMPTAGFSDVDKIQRTLQVLRDDDWGRTQKAAKFLRKFARHLRGVNNQPVLDMLCGALDDANWSVRWAVAEALAVLRNPAASPHLRRRLGDESWIVQVAVLRSLAELRAVDCASDMASLLASERATVREATADALSQLRQPHVIPALGEALQRDGDEFVRLAAFKAIHRINPPQARPWLQLALSDVSLPLRHYALQQLAPQMDESDLPILQQLLKDNGRPPGEDESLRVLALRALQSINTPASRALLSETQTAGERAGA